MFPIAISVKNIKMPCIIIISIIMMMIFDTLQITVLALR